MKIRLSRVAGNESVAMATMYRTDRGTNKTVCVYLTEEEAFKLSRRLLAFASNKATRPENVIEH